MIRRRQAQEPSYDSVLDTMTNVVGILIILVALTRLGVKDAVERVRAAEAVGGIAVSREDVERAELDLKELRRLVESLRERWKGLSPQVPGSRIDLADLEKSLETLREASRNPFEVRLRKGDLEAELERLRREIGTMESQLEALHKELRRAKADLDETPAAGSRNLALRLPSPSEDRARGKKLVEYLCRGGEVYRLPSEELIRLCDRELESAARSRKFAGLGEEIEWTVSYLDETDVGDATFRVRAEVGARADPADGSSEATAMILVLELRPGARGEDAEALASGSSRLERELRGLDARAHWVYFWVHDDSFEVYLEARRIADASEIPAGWLPLTGAAKIARRFGAGGEGGFTPVPD